jgi:integrase
MSRTALTPRKVETLKPAPKGKRTQVMDSIVPGFGVRVTESGQRTFIYQGRFPGSPNQVRREIGRVGSIDLAAARDKAREWSGLIGAGIDPREVERKAEEARATARATTFEAVAEDYFREKLARQRSGKVIEKRFRKRLIPIFTDRPITDITDLDVLSKVVNPIKAQTPSQARQLFNDLGNFFAWVIDQRVYGIKASPCATIKISKIVGKIVPRQRVLNDDELRALWMGAGRLPYLVGPLYRGLILTALRLRELSNTERAEWHLHGNSWQLLIGADRMKGKQAHAVPGNADLREIYDACPKRGRYMFSFNGGEKPMTVGDGVKEQIDAEMLRVLREIAVERGDDPDSVELAHWVTHDIRRTVRSRLSRIKGIDLETREAVLAHVKPGIQRTYDVHDYFDEKREALALWAARLRQIVEPPPAASNVIPMHAGA